MSQQPVIPTTQKNTDTKVPRYIRKKVYKSVKIDKFCIKNFVQSIINFEKYLHKQSLDELEIESRKLSRSINFKCWLSDPEYTAIDILTDEIKYKTYLKIIEEKTIQKEGISITGLDIIAYLNTHIRELVDELSEISTQI